MARKKNPPKCKREGCDNPAKYNSGRAVYQEYCGNECRELDRPRSEYKCACGNDRHRQAEKCIECAYLDKIGCGSGVPAAEKAVIVLRKFGEQTPQDVANVLRITPGQALDALIAAKEAGKNVHNFGDVWSLERAPKVGGVEVPELVSDKDGWHVFGAMGDTHLCSVHERLAELRDFYRIVEANGIKHVFHAGNYIDGEARFNKHELLVHGMDRQLQYLGEHYPNVQGVETHAISGDDHEGWYCQREGVDIGAYAQQVMRQGGRQDWHNLGYMECFVPMKHAETGKQSMLHVIHPGGGSAYATSYTVQKIAEGYEGGEKPAVMLAGHYHKSEHLEVRNIHCFQTGCFQDQTVFARKKKLTFTIGGWILMLRQNPETGAVEDVVSYFKPYYNRGYYQNNRWSLSGPVTQVPRIRLK